MMSRRREISPSWTTIAGDVIAISGGFHRVPGRPNVRLDEGGWTPRRHAPMTASPNLSLMANWPGSGHKTEIWPRKLRTYRRYGIVWAPGPNPVSLPSGFRFWPAVPSAQGHGLRCATPGPCTPRPSVGLNLHCQKANRTGGYAHASPERFSHDRNRPHHREHRQWNRPARRNLGTPEPAQLDVGTQRARCGRPRCSLRGQYPRTRRAHPAFRCAQRRRHGLGARRAAPGISRTRSQPQQRPGVCASRNGQR